MRANPMKLMAIVRPRLIAVDDDSAVDVGDRIQGFDGFVTEIRQHKQRPAWTVLDLSTDVGPWSPRRPQRGEELCVISIGRNVASNPLQITNNR